MNEQPQVILPAQEYIDILRQVLEMNQAIIRQNALIVQSITLPLVYVKGDK